MPLVRLRQGYRKPGLAPSDEWGLTCGSKNRSVTLYPPATTSKPPDICRHLIAGHQIAFYHNLRLGTIYICRSTNCVSFPGRQESGP